MTTKFPTEKKSLQNVNEKAYIQRFLLAKKLVFSLVRSWPTPYKLINII